MSIAHLLEEFGRVADFAVAAAAVTGMGASNEAIETARLDGYEDGYKAGWDDAIGANTAEQLQLSADLSQNLRDISFTYQEAVTHVTTTLHGVFDGMLTHFLPEAAQLALAPKVREVISALPLSSDNMHVTLSVSEANLHVMEKIVGKIDHAHVDLQEDRDLTAGQVAIRFDNQEVALDFDALLDELRVALAAALPRDTEEVSHG